MGVSNEPGLKSTNPRGIFYCRFLPGDWLRFTKPTGWPGAGSRSAIPPHAVWPRALNNGPIFLSFQGFDLSFHPTSEVFLWVPRVCWCFPFFGFILFCFSCCQTLCRLIFDTCRTNSSTIVVVRLNPVFPRQPRDVDPIYLPLYQGCRCTVEYNISFYHHFFAARIAKNPPFEPKSEYILYKVACGRKRTKAERTTGWKGRRQAHARSDLKTAAEGISWRICQYKAFVNDILPRAHRTPPLLL